MEKRVIIGIGIFLFVSYFVWYVYSNYISTKKNYEKIFDKYFTQKYVDNLNLDSDLVKRQMIEDLLPLTKYKLKFCENKDALSDSPINKVETAFRMITTSKYSEDFDEYELASIHSILDWSNFINISRTYKNEKDPSKKEPLKEFVNKYEDKNKYFELLKLWSEGQRENAKSINEYLSKEDALKNIRNIDGLC